MNLSNLHFTLPPLLGVVVVLFPFRNAAQAATVVTNATFTEILAGNIVSDHGNTFSGSWGDYNNDGYLDLIAANGGPSQNENEFLYRNDGAGAFASITGTTVVTNVGYSFAAAWADYDNDGYLDLFIPNLGQKNFLYHNNGDGTFTKITTGSIANDIGNSVASAWGDYDNDGFLDLFVANRSSQKNFLYHNNGDGTFTRITTGILVTDVGNSEGCAWGDYDNDGYLDLFVANFGQRNFLYHNNGNGSFTKIATGNVATDVANSVCASWGDYNNDGYLDLFVSSYGGNNLLYRNNQNGSFTRITTGRIVQDGGTSVGGTWGDYDNDGYLDLFVSNASGEQNFLYRNNGDGTFGRITTGRIATDGGDSIGCSWGDYDNDGFLDLFVANRSGQNNFLYHNDGNSNHWLRVQCIGTASNHAAIGAKIRIKATIAGTERWQLRQISGGDGENNSDSLLAQFGLGDATVNDTVRVEWPSGAVQEFTNVAVNQTLKVREPPRLTTGHQANAVGFQLNLIGVPGLVYLIEASTDLTNWTPTSTITNLSRTTPFTDPELTNYSGRFYRATELAGSPNAAP
jgi:uncharacterized membrane protein YeaQ/YmgE (transglycosylase-associated protein family)